MGVVVVCRPSTLALPSSLAASHSLSFRLARAHRLSRSRPVCALPPALREILKVGSPDRESFRPYAARLLQSVH